MAAAEPQLASTLLESSKYASDSLQSHPRNWKRLATDCHPINAMLEGGLGYGSDGNLCCISAEDSSNVNELSLSFLTSHLLSGPAVEATVIDTTLGFDIRQLYDSLMAKLQGGKPELAGDVLKAEALATLERVQIMKVFDFVGMTESVDEIRTRLQSKQSLQRPILPDPPAPKGTISDSENEGEEMLDVPSPTIKGGTRPPKQRVASVDSTDVAGDGSEVPGFLLITNIAHVTNPLLKQNYAQGQALLSSFMRSLAHLTREQNLCTMILNTTMSPAAKRDKESPSIFSSCNLQPSLGRSFSYLVDLHLLLHKVPKTAEDAKVLGSEAKRRNGRAQIVNVLEVMQDRYSGRVGRWAAVTTGPGAQLQAAL